MKHKNNPLFKAILFLTGIGLFSGCENTSLQVSNSEGEGEAIAASIKPQRRTYYIAADEVEWNYAPAGKDVMRDAEFDETQSVFTANGPTTIGTVYKKAIYREYTDASFTTLKQIPPAWMHKGIMGPIIHVQVGDTLHVVFKNNSATRPYSIHPHGVFYTLSSEGMGWPGMDPAMNSMMGIAGPGETVRYTWPVPERAGPGPADGSSINWPYHSHFDEPADVNTGLIGQIIVVRKGKMSTQDGGRPVDVDRELFVEFNVFNENMSWYLDENILKTGTPGDVDKESDDFIESNLKHGMNGFLYSNLPGLTMKKGQRVRWYLMGLGTEVDLHTPHWHGNTVLGNGHRMDVAGLLPAETKVFDMVPDNVGTWMFHCHVDDHIIAGMIALFTVLP
jgi:manganese oxidase